MRKMITGCVIAAVLLLLTSCSDHADKEKESEGVHYTQQNHIPDKQQQEQLEDYVATPNQDTATQQELTGQSKPELPHAQLTNKVELEYIEYDRDVVSYEDLNKRPELEEWQTAEVLEWYNRIVPDTLEQAGQIELVPTVQMAIQLPRNKEVKILYAITSPDKVYLQLRSSEIITYRTDAEDIKLLLETLLLDGPYKPIEGIEYRILTEEYLVNDDPDNPEISLFYREYKVYKDYMTGSTHGVSLEQVENMSEAKKALEGFGSLKLPPNTIVSPKVLKQWQAEGYYPVQEYSEESVRGLTYDDLLERGK
ncbi:hypothetical protein PUW24_03365 [Paenibacillus urinalis]|uniref:Lipoprotein n=1 Tax=Paenibacillus urinalis TaxID=521520 RepID=A0AAX3MWJ2_9BACL|nr:MULTISPECIES: hypothetical protein [Paenibacillus]WDH81985.1 hypothetical protein PUW23_21210 [Paenibacillus urinalis]WDH98032.1 hypothetical protein PUW24_03365 [Paenibacillus urinalis]WDI01714.1 hypothetical protein PUW25_21100 [Paenibacillus urinalis]GAK42484.1 hypothetical protein TCA2_4976 [Paenibacillus sp. TCA20]